MAIVTNDPGGTIAEDMRRLPREARKHARPKLRQAGDLIGAEAQSRASWSTRIPATVRVTTSFRFDREGVTVSAGGPSTPHARPYEGTRRNPFRHPVYPDQDVTRSDWTWVSQAARPFLIPAGRALSYQAEPLIMQGLGEAAAVIGFTG